MKNNKRFPAEWESQSFLQLTFPHKNSDWNYLLNEVSATFIEIIRKASNFQDVLVVCDDIKRVKSLAAFKENVFFVEVESDDTWARDHGGITVFKNEKPVILDFKFNGWGNKFDAQLDNQITRKLFDKNVFEECELRSVDFVLEGGSIESDGKGTILTTAECLLSKNRNEQYSKKKIEEILKENLGAKRILWLNHGFLSGDDTDSHIDTLARFCNEHTIAYVGSNNQKDVHFDSLQQMKLELQQMVDFEGNPYHLVELPFPDACYDDEGNRLPATYANFTILNGAVFVSVYGLPQDEEALKILRTCFPEKEIIGINCRILIEQHGSLHCITMQYPESVILNKKQLISNG